MENSLIIQVLVLVETKVEKTIIYFLI